MLYAFSVATLLTLEAYDALAEEQIFFHNRTADFVYVTVGVIESSGNTLPRSSLGLCMCVCVSMQFCVGTCMATNDPVSKAPNLICKCSHLFSIPL